jgi:pimeloyl-ACP methyl ester carboxylesterase
MRFHVAEMGEVDAPAVLLLHGFPMFWWTWRRQLVALAEAGYRAIAMDLRGYGGSDHPPHGYDARTMAADVAGVIRALGVDDAVIAGHGWGGITAWSMPVLHPEIVNGVIVIGAPHPRVMRKASFAPSQAARLGSTLGLQLPFAPERTFTRHDGLRLDAILRAWSVDTTWVDEASETIRSAYGRWPTAHTAIESYRWAFRSLLRTDGLSYFSDMRAKTEVDVLQLHGANDPVILPSSCDGSEQYVLGNYERHLLPGGHFVHEESGIDTTEAMLKWLDLRR